MSNSRCISLHENITEGMVCETAIFGTPAIGFCFAGPMIASRPGPLLKAGGSMPYCSASAWLSMKVNHCVPEFFAETKKPSTWR
ncbi:hypothetical protein [Parvibaculum sp.]|uniref:hypothetical protein n=1 Tax=Parvibaculum sp. TaxID=2024848 RepID=UPI0038B269C5